MLSVSLNKTFPTLKHNVFIALFFFNVNIFTQCIKTESFYNYVILCFLIRDCFQNSDVMICFWNCYIREGLQNSDIGIYFLEY